MMIEDVASTPGKREEPDFECALNDVHNELRVVICALDGLTQNTRALDGMGEETAALVFGIMELLEKIADSCGRAIRREARGAA